MGTKCSRVFLAGLFFLLVFRVLNSYNVITRVTISCGRRAIVERIEEEIVESLGYRAHNRLLDVGFGAGSYLSAASKAGWNASGIEVSKPAFEQARKAGLDVFCGQLLEAHYPENYFDVVLAVEVLEHLPRPRELVREISRILRPCGLFWRRPRIARGYHIV